MRHPRTRFVVALAAAAAVACANVQSQRRIPSPSELERDMTALLEKLTAIGATAGGSIAIVRGDETIYSRAFGLADQDSARPVTADTQFYIASTTKTFTGLAAATLHRRGDLNLDQPIRHYLPHLVLHDGLSPDRISVRDLLTMTHGISGNGPVTFRTSYSGEHTNAQLLDLLRLHRPLGHRRFTYSNTGYNIFGLMLDARFKEGWSAVLNREVLAPIGMTRTTTRFPADRDALAMPHAHGPSGPVRVPYLKGDSNVHAAGGHLSTANDLARYLRAHINAGRVDGVQVIAADAIADTQQARVDQDRDGGSIRRTSWGLGWDIGIYKGEVVLHRPGGFSGFLSHVSFMPAHKIGVVVLLNSVASTFADIVMTYAYDRLRGESGIDAAYDKRIRAYEEVLSRARATAAGQRRRRAELASRSTTQVDYEGVYENPLFGRINVMHLDGVRWAVIGAARSVMHPRERPHEFDVDLDGATAPLRFEVAAAGGTPQRLSFRDNDFARVER